MPPASYKRSWKNLLINKRYQLRFTLFMVGLSGLLMAGLGMWVMKEANQATQIAVSSQLGVNCGSIEVTREVDNTPPPPPSEDAPVAPPPTPMASTDPKPVDNGSAGSGSSAGSDAAPPVHHAKVQLEESTMTMVPQPPPPPPPTKVVRNDLKQQVIAYWTCKVRTQGTMDEIDRRRDTILYVLIGAGVLLVLGLAGYGLKMTHKVAGPLFKVSLYLGKMRAGRYDKVYNLRKGDQLVEFYEHFKHGHAGVVAMEKADIDHLTSIIASAEAAGLGDHEAVVAMREMLARKEAALK